MKYELSEMSKMMRINLRKEITNNNFLVINRKIYFFMKNILPFEKKRIKIDFNLNKVNHRFIPFFNGKRIVGYKVYVA